MLSVIARIGTRIVLLLCDVLSGREHYSMPVGELLRCSPNEGPGGSIGRARWLRASVAGSAPMYARLRWHKEDATIAVHSCSLAGMIVCCCVVIDCIVATLAI